MLNMDLPTESCNNDLSDISEESSSACNSSSMSYRSKKSHSNADIFKVNVRGNPSKSFTYFIYRSSEILSKFNQAESKWNNENDFIWWWFDPWIFKKSLWELVSLSLRSTSRIGPRIFEKAYMKSTQQPLSLGKQWTEL